MSDFWKVATKEVASFTDAWIETIGANRRQKRAIVSHLLQMRGLKLFVLSPSSDFGLSHLLQMRGLKPRIRGQSDDY